MKNLLAKKAGKPGVCDVFFLCFMAFFVPADSWAHGLSGQRFFPATLAVDDPFVSDELSLIYGHIREPDQLSNEFSAAFSKRITQNFAIELSDAYRFVKPLRGKDQNGFANLELGAKYQFLTNDSHELVLSAGLESEIGGTGERSVDADSFSTISPRFYFGKGFGDLPENFKYLKPLAITGAVGPDFPTRSKNVTSTVDPVTGKVDREEELNPISLSWGLTAQYSLQYLQSYVSDVGLGAPFNRTIVLVEFPLETGLNRGHGGDTTGFVNPGFIWFGKSFQLGIEAQIPINNETGSHVGVLAMVHFFIDDLFPKSLGRPLIH